MQKALLKFTTKSKIYSKTMTIKRSKSDHHRIKDSRSTPKKKKLKIVRRRCKTRKTVVKINIKTNQYLGK
jgi:hypothetical protein